MTQKRIIKAVLFDFWGTLVYHRDDPSLVRLEQTIENHPNLEKKAIQKIVMEQPHSNQQIENELRENFLWSKKEWKKVESFLNPFDVALYPDVIPTLMQLKKMNIKIGLISNTQSEGLIQAVQKCHLSKWINHYSWSFDVGATKPNRVIFDHALWGLKTKPSETLMVGDSLSTDMLGGKAAGLFTCLVDRTGKNSLTKECDFKVQQLTAIIEWVKRA